MIKRQPLRIPKLVKEQKRLLEVIRRNVPASRKEAEDMESSLREELNPNTLLATYGKDADLFVEWVLSLEKGELGRFSLAEAVDELDAWIASAPREGATINDQMVWVAGLEFGTGGGEVGALIESLSIRNSDAVIERQQATFENILGGEFLTTDQVARDTGVKDIEAGERDRFVPDVSDTPVVEDQKIARIYEEDLPGQTQESLWSLFNELGELLKTETDYAAQSVLLNRREAIASRLEREDQSIVDAPTWQQGTDSAQHPIYGDYESLLPEYMKDPSKTDPGAEEGDGGDGSDKDLTDEAYKYITENFGSVEFFLTTKADDMLVDTPRGRMNIIRWLEEEQEENPDVIWGLFQQTKWFEENGPTSRQFQMDWVKAGGTDGWNPQWNPTAEGGWMNMTPDMEEMLDDTYDSLIQEAARIGISTDTPAKKEAIMQMAYNARQLNMTDYELKNEFITNVNLAFDPDAVKNSGTFGAIRNKLKSNAATYMISVGDQALNELAQQIYLNKATYEGLSAVWAQQAREDNPAVASLIDQGYTPSAYFSSYANVASNLLGRQIDFLGGDNKMYGALTDTMIGENGLQRPMTRGEFKRYVRSTPEWDGTENARDEAYSTVGTLLDSFGVKV